MAEKPFDACQYPILQERIWKYNDLLWKNFLAYGGALVILGKLIADGRNDSALSSGTVQLVGSILLLVLALIQCALLSALGRHAADANQFEKEKGWRIITLGREDVRELKQVSVQDAYTIAVFGMFAVPIISLLMLALPIGHCCGK